MMTWQHLQKGDIVDIVSPGFRSTDQEVINAQEFLKRWGLVPRVPKKLLEKHYLLSNKDEKRFTHLKEALLAKDSKAIWCLRGGYGSIRLLPMLDQVKKPAQEKLIIGLSDITSLHIYVQQKWGWSTLHTSLLDRLGNGKVPPKVEKEIMALVFGKKEKIEFKKLKAMNEKAKTLKKIKAPVVGGNLTVLQSTLGTPYQFNADGKILFIEDLGERGYRVDRILEQFAQAGIYKKCKALVIGEFLGGNEPNSDRALWPQVFKEWSQRLQIPVFSGVESGHGEIQRPVPFNTQAELQGGARGTLVIASEGK